jgi:hypothetical protein
MKKHFIVPFIWGDESESFIFDDFLDRAGHIRLPLAL